MVWIRYLAYFLSIALCTWAITQMELASPGSLKLHVVVSDGDVFGTSEFSPVEIVQAIILFTCGLMMAWVARYCGSQRPLAILLGGLALRLHGRPQPVHELHVAHQQARKGEQLQDKRQEFDHNAPESLRLDFTGLLRQHAASIAG